MKLIRSSILLTLFLCLSLTTFGQIIIKDSLQAILNNDAEPEVRFAKAGTFITYNVSPEEAETLGTSVLYPFVQKNWENQSDQLSRLSRINIWIGLCYRERGGEDRDERERFFNEKGLEIAVKSGNSLVCAYCYNVCAFMEIKRGDIPRAHEHLYQAIIYYDKVEYFATSFEMLGVIGTNFFQIKDTDGMERILQQMEEYFEKIAKITTRWKKQPQYQYNNFKHNYFDLLVQKEKTENETINYALIDSAIVYIKQNIMLVENFLEELSPNWMQSYAYYYLAKALDDYYPEQTDTIFFYLDKAFKLFELQETTRLREANSAMEFEIHANIVRANTFSRMGKTQDAYVAMNEALRLLNVLHHYQNLDEHRYKAYQFMTDYYEQTKHFDKALSFQKLLRESEAKRYEANKIQAINDMSAKYETEKKEVRIQTLIKEKIATQRILWLAAGLSLTLLIVFLLIILSNRLKRKNVEQQLYETALLAELRQDELEKMQNLQQELEQNPVKNTIDKIAQMISTSLIEKDDKKIYLERLSKLDSKLLEHVYQKSKAKITGMDMKYIICFSADIDVKDISLLFNIEPASVHTVRYRIKKKFAEKDAVKFLI